MTELLLPFHSSFLGDEDNFHWECLKILECGVMEQQLINSCFSKTRGKKKSFQVKVNLICTISFKHFSFLDLLKTDSPLPPPQGQYCQEACFIGEEHRLGAGCLGGRAWLAYSGFQLFRLCSPLCGACLVSQNIFAPMINSVKWLKMSMNFNIKIIFL